MHLTAGSPLTLTLSLEGEGIGGSEAPPDEVHVSLERPQPLSVDGEGLWQRG